MHHGRDTISMILSVHSCKDHYKYETDVVCHFSTLVVRKFYPNNIIKQIYILVHLKH